MNLEDIDNMEEKCVDIFDVVLIGAKIINTLAIILVVRYTLGTYLGTFNYWYSKHLEFILIIWRVLGGLFVYWMWKK